MNELICELTRNNTGLTPDDPIVVICPKCGSYFCSRSVRFDKDMIEAYCYLCRSWFFYAYDVNRWYCCSTQYNSYIMRRGINMWEWESAIGDFDLLKHLYNKYKNDPKIAPQIMAEILGA